MFWDKYGHQIRPDPQDCPELDVHDDSDDDHGIPW
jgi:hypothetical protein